MVQARQKIKPTYFKALFEASHRLHLRYFHTRRWKGFRLWACDGTGIRLPNEPWIGDHFGWHQNQHSKVASTRILCTYDVLNELVMDIQLHAREQAERTIARPLVENIPADVVLIYDRGFCGYALPWLHQHYGSHCIIRLTSNFNPTVVEFIKSGQKELMVQAPMAERAVRSLRKLGFNVSKKDQLNYRLVRVDLPNGTVEVLLTTLPQGKKWPAADFKHLYNLRWGVETCFHLLKSYFQATLFSSYKVEGVEQELWALFTLFNLQTACQSALRRPLKKKSKTRVYDYRLNRNVGLGYLKRHLASILLHPLKHLGNRLDRLLSLLLSATQPVRPRKNRTRKKRIMRSNERHNYESNYKSSI